MSTTGIRALDRRPSGEGHATGDGWQLEQRVSARARHIRIEVRPPRTVRLIVPRGVAPATALAFLDSRRAWIETTLRRIDARQAQSPWSARDLRWDGSDQLPLRGRLVPVELRDGVGRGLTVDIGDASIRLSVPGSAQRRPAVLRAALSAALRREARAEAQRLLEREASTLRVDFIGPRIGDPTTRWGSCTSRGVISLSWRLLLAPPDVFRYVVVHELCHRRHLDHSPRFWACVASVMPEHAQQRAWLREHGAGLQGWLASR